MNATVLKPFVTLTAADLMSHDLVTIPEHMSLRKAAHLLAKAQVSGAPVIDSHGVCVGVLSATDFVHLADAERRPAKQEQDSCVCSEWQVIEVESLPGDEVCCFMTRNPVTVMPSAVITDVARMMLDAHIHRLIVVDGQERPIGIVSSTDVLAAVAYADHAL